MSFRIPPAALAPLVLAIGSAAAAAQAGITMRTFTKTSTTTGEPRPLETFIWYPAVPHTGRPDDLGRRDAKVRRGPFPLIVFSHGACGRPTESTYLTMALAKAGFVVAAPRHLGNSADDPDCVGTFVDSLANRVPDVRFIIDSMLDLANDPSSGFAARLQAERIAVAGFAESESAFARLSGPRFLVELLGGNHLSVVDDCYNQDLGVSFCVPDDIPQEKAHRLVLRYALPFLRRYLAERPVPRRALAREVDGVVLSADP